MAYASSDANKFKEYHSIENSYSAKVVDAFAEQVPADAVWIALEKVHGANFSATLEEEAGTVKVRFGRRGSYLGEESFYGSKAIEAKYTVKLVELYKLAKVNDGDIIRVYGELYGGCYPGHKSKSKPVQKGVYYCLEQDFIVYDIRRNDEYLSYPQVLVGCTAADIPVLPILHRGSMKEMLALNPAFPSQVYRLHGLEEVPNNLAEGYVLKPMNVYRTRRGERVILKYKNPAFAENVRNTGKTEREEKLDASLYQEVVEKALGYVNTNRLDAVKSKLSETDQECLPKVAGILASDALKDFLKEYEGAETLSVEVKKQVIGRAIQDAARKLVYGGAK